MKIQRLNMDNCWCIDFEDKTLLIDPWLKGAEVDYFSWFNKQWLRTTPVSPEDVPAYDYVVITQKYPDHFHPETLLALQPKKLIVPKSILAKVKSLLPNSDVDHFGSSPVQLDGSKLRIHALQSTRKMDPIYDALLIENGEESIFLATHGFTEPDAWLDQLSLLPAVTLAFTPFDEYRLPSWLGGAVTPGLDAVKDMITSIKPHKIVATHDEDKIAKGLISKLARITRSPDSSILLKQDLFKNRLLHITDYNWHII